MQVRTWVPLALVGLLGCSAGDGASGKKTQGECRTSDDCSDGNNCMDCRGFDDGTQCKIAAGPEVTSGKGYCLPMKTCKSDADCCEIELSKGMGMKCDGEVSTLLETLPGWCSLSFEAPTCKASTNTTPTTGCYSGAFDTESLKTVYYCRNLPLGTACTAMVGELTSPTVIAEGCPPSQVDSCTRDGVTVLIYQEPSSSLRSELCRSTLPTDAGTSDSGAPLGCPDWKAILGSCAGAGEPLVPDATNPCVARLDTLAVPYPGAVNVAVDCKLITQGQSDGDGSWSIDGVTVTLTGTVCDRIKSSGATRIDYIGGCEPLPATAVDAGTSPPASLGIMAPNSGFDATVGTTSDPLEYVVINTGGQSGSLSVTLTGSNSADFRIGNDGCTGLSLAQYDSCVIDVAFVPSAPGTKSAYLEALDTTGAGIGVELEGLASE